MDSRRIEHCQDSRLRSVACADGDPGGCLRQHWARARDASRARSRPAPAGPAGRCVGSALTYCDRGVEATLDCAAAGVKPVRRRGVVRAARRADSTTGDTCTGNTLRVCLSGNPRDIDCAALGTRHAPERTPRLRFSPKARRWMAVCLRTRPRCPMSAPTQGPRRTRAVQQPPRANGGWRGEMQPGSIPAAAGGPIVPGHYVLTSWSVYAPTGPSR